MLLDWEKHLQNWELDASILGGRCYKFGFTATDLGDSAHLLLRYIKLPALQARLGPPFEV
jgi:hypothetical protein